MQKPDFNIPSYKDSIVFKDYKLRTGDRLYVRVYSTDQKTNAVFNGSENSIQMISSGGGENSSYLDLYTYLIKKDGNILFPMIGDVKMSGKTIREATVSLEKAIAPLYRFSTVDLRVVNRYFSVIGAGRSGLIQMPREKINIFQALAMAGDIDMYGDRHKIRILRETDKGVQVKVFDIRSKDIIHSEYYYIEPNDVIYIQTLDEQFFSITNLAGLFSTVISTFSFGLFIYKAINGQ